MLKLAITGCTGRMGRMLLKEVNQGSETEVVGALTRPGNPFVVACSCKNPWAFV